MAGKQVFHWLVRHNLPFPDDGDPARKLLRLFKIVRGEHNGGSFSIDSRKVLPHTTTKLDIHSCSWFIKKVQSLLSIFVESGLTSKSADTGQARRFIEDQIKLYEQRLTEAENRVKEFKLQNMDLNAPAGGDFFSGLAGLTDNLRLARQQLQESIRSRDALKQQMADEDSQPPSLLPGGDNAASASTPIRPTRPPP